MTVPKKVVISLLLSVFLFSFILAFAYIGFFDFIESRFYNPSVTAALIRETGWEAEIAGDFLSSLQKCFLSLLDESSVRRSFLPAQYNADMYERSKIFGALTESVSGLNSVRFIDSGGTKILYSTYPPDIITPDVFSAVYRNYSDDPFALPFDKVDAPSDASSDKQYKLIFHRDELIFSFPFFDDSDTRMGVALFAVSSGELIDALIATGRPGFNEKLIFYSDGSGCLAGVIRGGFGISEKDILNTAAAVSSAVAESRRQGIIPFAGAPFALVLASSEHGFCFGRIVKEDLLNFPQPLKAITLVSIFLTIFLIVFFIFNLWPGSDASVGADAGKTQASVIVKNTGAMTPVENHGHLDLEELENVEEEKDYREIDVNWVEIESPFSTLLSDTSGEVIYEQNGIPYINNETAGLKKNIGEKLNDDFEKLVDSVISKSK